MIIKSKFHSTDDLNTILSDGTGLQHETVIVYVGRDETGRNMNWTRMRVVDLSLRIMPRKFVVALNHWGALAGRVGT